MRKFTKRVGCVFAGAVAAGVLVSLLASPTMAAEKRHRTVQRSTSTSTFVDWDFVTTTSTLKDWDLIISSPIHKGQWNVASLIATNKRVLLEDLPRLGGWPLKVPLMDVGNGCSGYVVYQDAASIPATSVPSPCGDTPEIRSYVIYYSAVER